MKNLMKYEMRKTLNAKLILLGITAVAEIVFLIGLYAEQEGMLAIGIGILFVLAMGGVLAIGLQSIVTLHRDMNTKQSYMLFMTPNSSYKILGAKVLENGLSILIAGAFFFALGMLDITLLFAKEGSLQKMWEMFGEMINSINKEVQLNAQGMACFVFSLLTGWIATVTAAFLADVVSSALLNGKKFNGILSFVLFLALSFFMGWLEQKVIPASPVNRYFLLSGVLSLVLSGLMYVGTAEIMERKLSV